MWKISLDQRHYASTNSTYKFILPGLKRPAEGKLYFREVTYSADKEYVKTEPGAYQFTEDRAQIGRVRHTKDRQTVAIELIKSHIFGDPSFKTIEIILFKCTLTRQQE
jgi:hypothetical protein